MVSDQPILGVEELTSAHQRALFCSWFRLSSCRHGFCKRELTVELNIPKDEYWAFERQDECALHRC